MIDFDAIADVRTKMIEFDRIKALREEIAGLSEVAVLITRRVHKMEQELAEAEVDHNALLKMQGTIRGVIDGMRTRLRAWEAEAGHK